MRPSSLDDASQAVPRINKQLFRRVDRSATGYDDYLSKLGDEDVFADDARYDMRIDSRFRFDAQCDPSLLDSDLLYADDDLSHPSRQGIVKHRTTIALDSTEADGTTGERVAVRERMGERMGVGDRLGERMGERERLADSSTERLGLREAGLHENYRLGQLMTRRGHSLTHVDSSKELQSSSQVRLARSGQEPQRYEGPTYEEYEGGGECDSQDDGNEQSVISALTNESDVEDTMRTRSISEAVVHRRLSLVQTKDKVLSVWDRLLHRRRGHMARSRHHDSSPSPLRTSWLRFRSADAVGFNGSF